jgi:hypothetical protein
MLRAILIPVRSTGYSRPRFTVGVIGTAPSGLEVRRPRYLTRGPWCKTTARLHAKRLQNELDRGLHGALLGWKKLSKTI